MASKSFAHALIVVLALLVDITSRSVPVKAAFFVEPNQRHRLSIQSSDHLARKYPKVIQDQHEIFRHAGDRRHEIALGRNADISLMTRNNIYTSTALNSFPGFFLDDDENTSPRPPQPPPASDTLVNALVQEYKDLQNEQEEAKKTLEVLEKQVEKVKEELASKEGELRSDRDSWGLEKISLVAKIAEFKAMLEQREEQKQAAENDEEEQQNKEQLEKEVELLQGRLSALQNSLRAEQGAAEEINKRMSEVEDQIQLQQTGFDKEKLLLQESLEKEQEKLSKLSAQWQEDQQSLLKDEQSLQDQLRTEKERLETSEQQWEKSLANFKQQQFSLQELVRDQKERIKEAESKAREEKDKYSEERKELQMIVEREQSKLADAETTLRKEKKRFSDLQKELRAKISAEKNKVKRLNNKLEQENAFFEREKYKFEVRIEQVQERLATVEEELAQEKVEFLQEKGLLEDDVVEQDRLNRVKEKHMMRRYETIRTDLMSLVKGTKRDAAKEEDRLKLKYEKKVSDIKAAMDSLRKEFIQAKQTELEIQDLISEQKREKEIAEEETLQLQNKYAAIAAERSTEIAAVRDDIETVRVSLVAKEAELAKYENSFREQFKLSVRLTRKRFRKPKLFRRKRKQNTGGE